MRSALPSTLVVVGIAIVSLSPASPRILREFDLVALHAYHLLDVVSGALLSLLSDVPDGPPPEVDREMVREGIARWDRLLASGAARLAPDHATLIARVVEVEPGGVRFLIDAGPGAPIAAGDAVLAGDIGVGLVVSVDDGVALVETPFAADARLAGVCDSQSGRPVRFITVGQGAASPVALVTNPEGEDGLVQGASVLAAEVGSLIPVRVDLLPPGARVGLLERDEVATAAAGEPAFRVVPILDPRALDAVAVITRDPRDWQPQDAFHHGRGRRLNGGALTPWRDGFGVTGGTEPEGASVVQGGHLVGFVDGSVLGASRVRGLADASNRMVVLGIAPGGAYLLAVRALGGRNGAIRFQLLSEPRRPAVGDWIVSGAGRRHLPRGLPIGVVTAVDDHGFAVQRERVSGEVDIVYRAGFPADPWGA